MDARESLHVRVTLIEGRNRQVRRMFQIVGRTVVALQRVAIGPLHIGGLSAGEVRPLRPREIESLLALKRVTRSRRADVSAARSPANAPRADPPDARRGRVPTRRAPR